MLSSTAKQHSANKARWVAQTRLYTLTHTLTHTLAHTLTRTLTHTPLSRLAVCSLTRSGSACPSSLLLLRLCSADKEVIVGTFLFGK